MGHSADRRARPLARGGEFAAEKAYALGIPWQGGYRWFLWVARAGLAPGVTAVT